VTGATQVSFTAGETGIRAHLRACAKTNFFDRRLLINAAVYHSDYDDKQIRSKLVDPIFGPLPALVNVPKSTINGAELEISARPVTRLTLGTSINYLHTKLDNTRGPDGNSWSAPPTTRRTLPAIRSPIHQMVAGRECELRVSDLR